MCGGMENWKILCVPLEKGGRERKREKKFPSSLKYHLTHRFQAIEAKSNDEKQHLEWLLWLLVSLSHLLFFLFFMLWLLHHFSHILSFHSTSRSFCIKICYDADERTASAQLFNKNLLECTQRKLLFSFSLSLSLLSSYSLTLVPDQVVRFK